MIIFKCCIDGSLFDQKCENLYIKEFIFNLTIFVDVFFFNMVEKEEFTRSKRSSLSRITVGLDDFDYKVVNKMAKNRNLPLSEAMRMIVHQWIEYNPDLLKKNYGVDFGEITEEIKYETTEISLDKSLNPSEKIIIKELPEFFEIVDEVSIKDLAEHFGTNVKTVKKIIFTHGKEIKKTGLDLKFKEGSIYKN